jgi:tRNA(Arg) A34 adenosine deaminase TadA
MNDPQPPAAWPLPEFRLPDWIGEVAGPAGGVFPSDDERMALAVALARRNAAAGGGPFGAAVFAADTGRLLAPGVNLVVPAGLSVAHAEVVALTVAQRATGSFDLGAGGAACELVTSAAPCIQCFGAVIWSGVSRLVCGARREDVEGIGFDEGPVPADWVAQLERRGIAVRRDVLRAEAAAVLAEYAASGAPIYNARREGS